MESTLCTTTLFTLSKTLNSNSNPFISGLHRHFSSTRPIHTQLAFLRLSRRLFYTELKTLQKFSYYSSSSTLRSLSAVVVHPGRSRLQCLSNSAASFASGGRGGGIGGSDSGGSGGGGSDGASEGWEKKTSSVSGGSDDVSASSSDVIILDVGGMSCGGCAASVKRILESQPQVSSASVNLTAETAVIWPVSEAKVVPNWQKNLGAELSKQLTSCGFKSNLRGEGSTGEDIPS